MFFTGVKFIAVSFMKGAKIPQTTDHTNWLIQQAGAFIEYFGEYAAKAGKLRAEPGIIKSFLASKNAGPFFQSFCSRAFFQ